MPRIDSPTVRILEAATKTRKLLVRAVSTFKARAILWLWVHRIALGKLTLLEGDPSLGKSTVAFDIAARVSAGRPMPFARPSDKVSPANVLIVSYEDDVTDTIRPRLEAAGADLTRCHIVTASEGGTDSDLIIPNDLAQLEKAIAKYNVCLVIIDPLAAALSGKIDSHKDQQIRQVLSRLRALAEKYQLAMIVIRHLVKAPGGSAISRGQGSIGIIGAARSALLVAKDPDDDGRRVLCQVKSNVGPLPKSAAFSIKGVAIAGSDGKPVPTSKIEWLGEVALTAEQLARGGGAAAEQPSQLDAAKAFLLKNLAGRSLPSESILHAAKKAGLSESTLFRAKKALGCPAKRIGVGPDKKALWQWGPLPPKKPGSLGDLEKDGDLGKPAKATKITSISWGPPTEAEQEAMDRKRGLV